MRLIAHLSDLHFGRVDPSIPPALHRALIEARPDVLVVSGDLTQRARPHEFGAARRFLNRLPFPQVVVPGNHDIPLHDVISRVLAPFRAYRRGFANELEPLFEDSEIAVVGINTARAMTFKDGRINIRQVERACSRLDRAEPTVTRVVVTHHPFDVSEPGDDSDVIGRAGMAMTAFAHSRVDLILSGHLHVGDSRPSALRYGDTGWSSLLVRAGTATSTRRRGEVNTFNLIRIDQPHVAVECMALADGGFTAAGRVRFLRNAEGWIEDVASASSDKPSP